MSRATINSAPEPRGSPARKRFPDEARPSGHGAGPSGNGAGPSAYGARAAAAYATAALVLLLTRYAPSFAFLGPRGELPGWLLYITIVTACLPAAVLTLGLRQPLAQSGLA